METKNNAIRQKSLRELLESMLSNLKNLTNIIAKENNLLSTGELRNLKKLADNKEQFATKLESIGKDIKLLVINEITSEEKRLGDAIKIAYNNLQQSISENDILLTSNIEVTNQILEIYKSKNSERALSHHGYDKNGAFSVIKRLEQVTPSTTLNNKI